MTRYRTIERIGTLMAVIFSIVFGILALLKGVVGVALILLCVTFPLSLYELVSELKAMPFKYWL